MRTAFFLIPTSYTGRGLPLDYQLTEHKVDKRTRFWRFNQAREVSTAVAIFEAERAGMKIFRDDAGNVCRILAPNGTAAKTYHDRMTRFGWQAYREGVTK